MFGLKENKCCLPSGAYRELSNNMSNNSSIINNFETIKIIICNIHILINVYSISRFSFGRSSQKNFVKNSFRSTYLLYNNISSILGFNYENIDAKLLQNLIIELNYKRYIV